MQTLCGFVVSVLQQLISCHGLPTCSVGTKIPFEQGLAATTLEGLVFILICVTGLRSIILKLFPKSVLMAGEGGLRTSAHKMSIHLPILDVVPVFMQCIMCIQ